MSRDEWFRSPDWGPEAERVFEERLERSAQHNRSQRLRIKALALLEVGDESRREAGRALLHRLVDEYPDALDVAWAHELLADAYRADGYMREAEAHYRQALRTYERRPNVRGYAHLGLAELIVDTRQEAKYSEAEALLGAIADDLPFHDVQFKWFVLRARLASRVGEANKAARYASAALDLAEITRPQLPRHPDVGLVKASPATLAEMRTLVDAV